MLFYLTYIETRYTIYLADVSTVDIAQEDTKVKIKEEEMAKKALTQPMYYILLSLKEARHGYEIMQYIEWLTGGRVVVGPGTLYSLLSRFEEDSWIKLISRKDNKKTYVITDKGKNELEEEIARLEEMLEDVRRVQGGNEDEFQNRE